MEACRAEGRLGGGRGEIGVHRKGIAGGKRGFCRGTGVDGGLVIRNLRFRIECDRDVWFVPKRSRFGGLSGRCGGKTAMDGMSDYHDFHGAPAEGVGTRGLTITAVAMTAAFFTAMFALTFLLHWLGWTPPPRRRA